MGVRDDVLGQEFPDEADGCFEFPGSDATEPPIRGGWTFPVSPKVIPAWVRAFPNGRIPVERMERVADCGRFGYLVPEAATAWRSLVAAAGQSGFALTMTGAYRSYDDQLAMFTERYATTDTGGPSKSWSGRTYWLRRGMAEAATPGNSNHGWGAAVDMALGRSPSVAKEPNRDPRFMDWAIANARQHGWSWETSEPWHLRLVEILGPSKHEMTLAKDATSAPTSASAPDPELRTGSTGSAVATLQTICMTHGWTDMTAADGKFGPRTEAAVKTMQGALGCTPDGVYGNRTAAALRNRLGREASGVQ